MELLNLLLFRCPFCKKGVNSVAFYENCNRYLLTQAFLTLYQIMFSHYRIVLKSLSSSYHTFSHSLGNNVTFAFNDADASLPIRFTAHTSYVRLIHVVGLVTTVIFLRYLMYI